MNENNNVVLFVSSYNKKFNEQKPANKNNNTKNNVKSPKYQIDANHKKISPKQLISSRNNNKLKLGTDINIKHVSPDYINNYIISEKIKSIIKAKQNQPQNIWIINNFLNSKDSMNNSSEKELKITNTCNNSFKKNNNIITNGNTKNGMIYRNNKFRINKFDEERYIKTEYNINHKGNNINQNIINKISNDNHLKKNNKNFELNKIENDNIKINKIINQKTLKEKDELINNINTESIIENCQKLMIDKNNKCNMSKNINNKKSKTSQNTNDGKNVMQIEKIKIPKGIKNNNNEQNKYKEKREDLFSKYTNAKAIPKLKGDYTFESLLGANLDTIQNLNYDNYYNSLIDDLNPNDKNNNIFNYNNSMNNTNNMNNEDNNSTYIDILSALKENNFAKIKKIPINNNEIDFHQNNKKQIILSENIDTNNEEQNNINISGKIKKIKLKLGRISNQSKLINNNSRNKGNEKVYYTNDNINHNNGRNKMNENTTNVTSRDRINNNNNMIYRSNIIINNHCRSGVNTPYRKKTPINKRGINSNSNSQKKIMKNNIKIINNISPRNNNNIINNKCNNIIIYSKKTKEIKSSISCTNIFKNRINK